MAFYVDTSAAVKLVTVEPESVALVAWLQAEPPRDLVSSDLLRTELLRATRQSNTTGMRRARDVLDALVLMTLPAATFEHAAELGPAPTRSLDALHLAAALELGDELEAIVTYDVRLGAAAEHHGVSVVAPR